MDNDDQSDVRQQIEGWREAISARDLDRVMSFYVTGEEFLGFDFVSPFMFFGSDAFRADWNQTFEMLEHNPVFDLKDVTVHCGGDLAVAYGLSHFSGVMNGNSVDVWTRQTNVFRKIGGRWLLVHEHASVPIDMATMKGVVDFKP